MKQWLKFFWLSYFSDTAADDARRHGYRNLFLGFVLAFLFFLAGFMCADVVPFSRHYDHASGFTQFVNSAFSAGSSGHGISLTVEKGTLKAAKAGEMPSDEKIANTYTDQADAAAYVLNGYDLIVDTRSAETPVVFTQTGVSQSGEEISYEQYLSLSDADKQNYTLKTEYTDEEMIVDDEAAGRIENFLANSAEAAADYGQLRDEANGMPQEEYRSQLYTLYVKYYYRDAVSVMASAKVPVLRDYYYRNYVLENKRGYLYLFGDIVYGSFVTDGGVQVSFGGFVSAVADGVVSDAGELIKAVHYGSAGYTATSYFLNTMMLAPLMVIIPLFIALLAWGAGKLKKCVALETYGVCVKTVGAFVWFSAFVTGIVAFVLGFFVGGTTAYSLILPIYAALLFIRSAVYVILKIVKKRKVSGDTNVPSEPPYQGEELYK